MRARRARARRGAGAPHGADLLDALLVRLGLAGVGVFASAGDFRSTCNGRPFPGLAWPASSPWLTSVGGTRLALNAANARTGEVVWNDLRWASRANGGGAGGSGLSRVSPRPPYQRRLTVPGRTRAAPDVAAHASMFPGWPVSISTNWGSRTGGTSASAPFLAGAFAALSTRERARGRPPLGPVNGLLYATAPRTVFDVLRGDNGYDRRVRARRASRGYDLPSGLGVPRLDVLAGALPRPGRRAP